MKTIKYYYYHIIIAYLLQLFCLLDKLALATAMIKANSEF